MSSFPVTVCCIQGCKFLLVSKLIWSSWNVLLHSFVRLELEMIKVKQNQSNYDNQWIEDCSFSWTLISKHSSRIDIRIVCTVISPRTSNFHNDSTFSSESEYQFRVSASKKRSWWKNTQCLLVILVRQKEQNHTGRNSDTQKWQWIYSWHG